MRSRETTQLVEGDDPVKRASGPHPVNLNGGLWRTCRHPELQMDRVHVVCARTTHRHAEQRESPDGPQAHPQRQRIAQRG